ncbi:probable disease resistance protein At5g66900 isoform X2 [Momordica charantia]|nr:probable disease resistance protein At5g66900 isoform X2 [Momordica charantia]XP_022143055.1 probable disease resistance protein At5g66900 isoform X2 [Momordica charantia]XP_022143056.1 probable disease resistance protein At5g66900 isoform X2 [Momordica charantia]
MAGAFIGGAALGAAFGELFSVIKNLGERAINFSSVLKEIEFKVKAILPLLKEIDGLNEALGYTKEEMEKLRNLIEDGKRLLLKCGDDKLGKLKWLKTPIYTGKLRELDASIRSFMDVLQLQTARDMKKNLTMTEKLMETRRNPDTNGGVSNTVDSRPCQVPDLGEESVGLNKPVEELKVKLLKDGVRMLVVTAPGGCGKTTLAVRFCHDKLIKDKFQNILFLTVSSKPDTKHILKDVILSLKWPKVLSYSQEDEQTLWSEARWLGQSSSNPVLIVLDDVWEGSESECLLSKFLLMPNCKILVTSRFKFPRFGEPYYLEPLNHQDARELFHRSASLDKKPRFPDEEIVEKIIRGCKRFPLALKVVARSLSGRAASVWKVAERKLCRGDSILGSERELMECLQSSLDAIPDENMVIKECFMDLGSFPEDQRIRVATFIDVCAVLYEQDECEAMTNLEGLSTRTLVSSVSLRNEACEDDYHSESYFTQHDVLRELAIQLINEKPVDQRTKLLLDINRNDFPKWWSEKEMQPSNARLLSITTDETFLSCWPDMEATEVEVLILNLLSKTYNLPEFMNRMNRLKALIVTNYGLLQTELGGGYQLTNCLSRLERIRLERISIPPFSNQNLKPLSHLKKISFYMCKVDKAFTNCSTQISTVLPNLLEISIDFCNDLMALPIGLCEIVSLEKLSITNCHGLTLLPEELGKLIDLKTLRLRSCIHLKELPESISRLQELVNLDISHCLGLTKLPEKIGKLQKLEKLNMWSCSISKPPASLRNLKNLKTVVCEKEIAKWFNIVSPRLRKLVKEHTEEANLDWLLA